MDKNGIINFIINHKYTIISGIFISILIPISIEIIKILTGDQIQIWIFIIFIVLFITIIIIILIPIIIFIYFILIFPSEAKRREKSSPFNQYCSAYIECIYEEFHKKGYITLKDLLNNEKISKFPKTFSKIFFNSLIYNYFIRTKDDKNGQNHE